MLQDATKLPLDPNDDDNLGAGPLGDEEEENEELESEEESEDGEEMEDGDGDDDE